MKPTYWILTLASCVLLFTSGISAQEATKKGKGKAKADPEGQPLRRAVPESVKVERDIVYAKYGEREVKLDLYLPKKPAGDKIPCIMVIHGGGWRSGDKNRFAPIAIKLAEEGFAAACIGYRLLPEVQFPAPVVDCKAAVRWVRANAAKHGINPDQIGAIGGSAGGHLVAMLGTSYKEKKLEGDGGNAGVSSRVQAVVAMATPADMTRFAERANLEKDLATLISPITHVGKDSAPILLLHSEADNLVPMAQSELLLKKYQDAKVPAELVKMGANHAFWNDPKYFDEVTTKSVKFFRAQLEKGK
ncbi:MAG: alpha/beta hydrolase [Verrucomicrobiota bacterium]